MKRFLKKIRNLKIFRIKIKFNINNDLEDIHSYQKKQKEDGKRNLNKRR